MKSIIYSWLNGKNETKYQKICSKASTCLNKSNQSKKKESLKIKKRG